MNSELELRWGNHRTITNFSSTREELDNQKIRDQDRFNLSYNFLFTNSWFVAANLTTEVDSIALLDRRTSINPAIGYDLFDQPDLSLSIELGGGFQNEIINGIETDSSLVDWRLRYSQDLFSGDLEIFHNHHFYQNLGGRENFVVYTESGLRYSITDDVYLNMQLNYDFDSEPVEGTDGKDLTFLFGVGVAF